MLPPIQPNRSHIVTAASDAIASRYSDAFKAFQFMDLDRSGKLGIKEIKHALNLWNLPIDSDRIDELLAVLDRDGDGQISYEEFVDGLVRDTVAPTAMNKRGLQSKEAMGVDAYAMLDEQLGHGEKKKFNPSINA